MDETATGLNERGKCTAEATEGTNRSWKDRDQSVQEKSIFSRGSDGGMMTAAEPV